MKETGQTITMTRDDSDYLLALGRKEGVSRVLHASSMEHLVERFRPDISSALMLPWPGSHQYVRFVPGKVSVWSGPSFAGKTAFLRQLMLHAISTNHRVLFISLEEEPDEVWREFTCMAACTQSPNKHQVAWSRDTFADKLWVFDSEEAIEPTVLMGIIRFAVEKYGFSHIVIDSLMRLALRTDDYDGQREMGNMLGRVAKKTKAHIHLVAHPRKTQNSREPMDLYDIRGAQDIIAQADSVFTLERNYAVPSQNLGKCTNILKTWKQRGQTNWVGTIETWYDPKSRQLRVRADDQPVRYLPCDAYDDTQVAEMFPEEAA